MCQAARVVLTFERRDLLRSSLRARVRNAVSRHRGSLGSLVLSHLGGDHAQQVQRLGVPGLDGADELAKDYTGKIKVGKMDVDSNSATPMRYGVRGIPTLLVFKGGQVKEQIVGYVPKETIQKAIDKHV